MTIKAALKIVLQAGDTVVAESEDAALWQRVLAAINQPADPAAASGSLLPSADAATGAGAPTPPKDEPVDRLAAQLAVGRETLEGACSPTLDAPYLHLDHHAWEDMKRSTPARGPGSIPPATIAATLLALWFRNAALGSATVKMAQAVLGTINLRDQNAARSIQGAEWLQARGGAIVLNPAKISRAIAVARAFCARDWTDYRTE